MQQRPLVGICETDTLEVVTPLLEPLVGGNAKRLAWWATEKQTIEVGVAELSSKGCSNCLSVPEIAVFIWRTVDHKERIVRPQRIAEYLVDLIGRKNIKTGLPKTDVHSPTPMRTILEWLAASAFPRRKRSNPIAHALTDPGAELWGTGNQWAPSSYGDYLSTSAAV